MLFIEIGIEHSSTLFGWMLVHGGTRKPTPPSDENEWAKAEIEELERMILK